MEGSNSHCHSDRGGGGSSGDGGSRWRRAACSDVDVERPRERTRAATATAVGSARLSTRTHTTTHATEECSSVSASSSTDVVRLNVGGKYFATALSTLRKETTSMLSAMFSGRFPLLRQPDGAFFIDRDGTHFRYVLNYLRDGTLLPLPESEHSQRELLREAQYYQLRGLIALLEVSASARPLLDVLEYCTLRYLPGATYDGWPVRLEGNVDTAVLEELNGGSPCPERFTSDTKNIFGTALTGWKVRGIYLTRIFNLLAAHRWMLRTSNGSGGGKGQNFAEMYVFSRRQLSSVTAATVVAADAPVCSAAAVVAAPEDAHSAENVEGALLPHD